MGKKKNKSPGVSYPPLANTAEQVSAATNVRTLELILNSSSENFLTGFTMFSQANEHGGGIQEGPDENRVPLPPEVGSSGLPQTQVPSDISSNDSVVIRAEGMMSATPDSSATVTRIIQPIIFTPVVGAVTSPIADTSGNIHVDDMMDQPISMREYHKLTNSVASMQSKHATAISNIVRAMDGQAADYTSAIDALASSTQHSLNSLAAQVTSSITNSIAALREDVVIRIGETMRTIMDDTSLRLDPIVADIAELKADIQEDRVDAAQNQGFADGQRAVLEKAVEDAMKAQAQTLDHIHERLEYLTKSVEDTTAVSSRHTARLEGQGNTIARLYTTLDDNNTRSTKIEKDIESFFALHAEAAKRLADHLEAQAGVLQVIFDTIMRNNTASLSSREAMSFNNMRDTMRHFFTHSGVDVNFNPLPVPEVKSEADQSSSGQSDTKKSTSSKTRKQSSGGGGRSSKSSKPNGDDDDPSDPSDDDKHGKSNSDSDTPEERRRRRDIDKTPGRKPPDDDDPDDPADADSVDSDESSEGKHRLLRKFDPRLRRDPHRNKKAVDDWMKCTQDGGMLTEDMLVPGTLNTKLLQWIRNCEVCIQVSEGCYPDWRHNMQDVVRRNICRAINALNDKRGYEQYDELTLRTKNRSGSRRNTKVHKLAPYDDVLLVIQKMVALDNENTFFTLMESFRQKLPNRDYTDIANTDKYLRFLAGVVEHEFRICVMLYGHKLKGTYRFMPEPTQPMQRCLVNILLREIIPHSFTRELDVYWPNPSSHLEFPLLATSLHLVKFTKHIGYWLEHIADRLVAADLETSWRKGISKSEFTNAPRKDSNSLHTLQYDDTFDEASNQTSALTGNDEVSGQTEDDEWVTLMGNETRDYFIVDLQPEELDDRNSSELYMYRENQMRRPYNGYQQGRPFARSGSGMSRVRSNNGPRPIFNRYNYRVLRPGDSTSTSNRIAVCGYAHTRQECPCGDRCPHGSHNHNDLRRLQSRFPSEKQVRFDAPPSHGGPPSVTGSGK